MSPHDSALRAGRIQLGLALLLLAVLSAVALVTRPLTPIDETRYVSAAWEMWLRGDFLVPYKNGEPYSHKPPMMFWMFHAGWAVFGVNEWWPRLVLPLYSAVALMLTYALGRRLWPEVPALAGRAALVLATSLLWIVFSTSVMFDVMLAVWVLLGMHGILSAAEGKRHGFVLLGAAVGLGVLTKGPVILLDLLPAAVLAPWWQGSRRDPDNVRAHRYWHRWAIGVVAAVLLGAALALAWAIPAGYAGGEAYRKAIFWGQTANRVVESFAHRRPFWWYLPLLPLLLFPWFVWPAFWKGLFHKVRGGLDRGMRFCIAWMLPVFVAFSFISGKQPHYLIPLFPAFALLLARVVPEDASHRGLPALLAGLLGAALIALATGHIAGVEDDVAALPPAWPGIALVVLALVVGWTGRRRQFAVPSLAVLGAGMLASVQLGAMSALAPLYDIRPTAEAIREVQASGHAVANLATYHAQYQFLGRLKAPLSEVRGGEIRPWLEAHPDGYAVMYLKDVRDLERVPARHGQAYRGGAVALVDASTALRLLDEHVE